MTTILNPKPLERVVPDEVRATVGRSLKVWDLPIRLFHWLLFAAVTVAIISGEVGGTWMDVHAKAGLTIIALVSFRLVWGAIGSTTARFTQFLPTRARLRAYLKGQWHGVGHNPLGALAVLAMLTTLGAQATLGLFADDEIAFTGPLHRLVEDDRALQLTGLHHKLAWVLFALIALHILAIAFYRLRKKKDLVTPMLTGWADAQSRPHAAVSIKRGSFTALVIAIFVAAATAFVANGGLLHKAKAPVKAAPEKPTATTVNAPAVSPANTNW